MQKSKFFWQDQDNEYGEGILLDEYHGKYSFVAAREAQNGEVYMQWCYPQGPDRTPREKGVPWKVNFGDRQTTIDALKYFLSILEAAESGGGDEIPF